MSNVGWRIIKSLCIQIPGTKINKAERRIMLPNGGEISIRSADHPDSLRGESLDFVVLDECAFMQSSAWHEALRPSLSDRVGKAMFISTPAGRGWFWQLFQQAADGGEYERWQLPTSDNPYILDSEIEAAYKTLPERIFQQEYEAMFLDDAGGVFRNVRECATAVPLNKADGNRQYIGGVDVATMVDFTVVSVLDVESKEMVYMDRFNRVEYPVLEDRINAVYNKFNMTAIVVESNSIGRPVIDHMRQRGMTVLPFTTTSATKTAIIQKLQTAFEHGNITILNDRILVNELLAFEGKQMATHWKYAAPAGLHDDCVMSLAIAWDAVQANNEVKVLW